MTAIDNFLRPGTTTMILGSHASAFAENARRELAREVNLPVIVLRASDLTLPALLENTHPTMATIIVCDGDTPETRCSELCGIADVVLRSIDSDNARVVQTRTRPTIRLEEKS